MLPNEEAMNAIQFNFHFDAQRIQEELQAIAESFYYINGLKIEEKALSGMHLITPSLDGQKNQQGYSYCSTPQLDQSPYLQSILDTFQCDKLIYRVHNLKAKGKIGIHRDLDKGLANNIVRIHIQ